MINNKQLTQEEYFLQAAGRGDFTTVEAMVRQQEVSVDSTDELGVTALIRSAERGDVRMTSYLLEMGANPNKQAHTTGESALLNATENNHREVIEILLDKGAHTDDADNHGKTPLLASVATKNLPLTTRFIKEGSNLDKQNIWGQTALHLSIQKGADKITETLLNAGANPNIADEKGQEPIHLAVLSKDIKTVALLLDFGAQLNATTKEGKKPIDLAIQKNDPQMFEFLARLGAETKEASASLETALTQTPAHQMKNILSIKDSVKVDIFELVKANEVPKIDEHLNGQFIDINKTNENGQTPIMVAAELGHFASFLSLYLHGADCNKQDKNGHTVRDVLLQSIQKNGLTKETKDMLDFISKAPVASQRARFTGRQFYKDAYTRA